MIQSPQILPEEIGDPDAEREASALEWGRIVEGFQNAGRGLALLTAVGLGLIALADIAKGLGL